MKKALLILIMAFFASLTFVVQSVNAQETVVLTDTPIGIEEPVATSTAANGPINYELPYPGILPDNPFYVLKMARDGIVKLLINVPIKKAQFSLLTAEKRMYAAKLLALKGSDKLAVETVGKSNNYFDDANKAVKATKKQFPKSTDIHPFLLQFQSAGTKHKEVVAQIKREIDKKYWPALAIEEKRIDAMRQNVEDLLRQK